MMASVMHMTDVARTLVADAPVMTLIVAMQCWLLSSRASFVSIVVGRMFGEPSDAFRTGADEERNG